MNSKFLICIALFATVVYSTCPTIQPDQYAATYLPSIFSATFDSSNQLKVIVSADAAVQGRVYDFQFAGENSATCGVNFHQGSSWNPQAPEPACAQLHTYTFTWSDLSAGASSSQKSNCGFSVYEVEDVIVYNATLIVTQMDTLSSIRDQAILRNTSSPLSLSITFPKYSVVNTSQLTIFAPIRVLSAIKQQSYDVVAHTGLFRLFTSVQYPFSLNSISVLTKGSDANLVLTPSTSVDQETYTCPPANSDCNVLYDLAISGDICRVNGNFTVQFQIGCRTTDDCPLQGGEHAVITWLTDSSNLCGVLNQNVTLDVDLKTYWDDQFQHERKGFLINQTIYLQASSSSADVTIAKTFIKNCTIFYGENSPSPAEKIILSGGTASVLATSASHADYVTSLSDVTASIIVDTSLFDVAQDLNITAKIGCYIGVQYANVAYTKRIVIGNGQLPKLGKRGVTPLFSTSSYGEASIVVEKNGLASDQTQQATQQPTSSGSFSQPIAMLALILIVSLSLLL